jgi:hypothetical protein
MSAYICDKNHIIYLVSAAMSRRLGSHHGTFSWHWGQNRTNMQRGELRCSDYAAAADIANTLWRENIRSVSYRYPGDKTSATLPGPITNDWIITVDDFHTFVEIDPVQVFKSIHCLEYQSCEHPEWEESEACAFLRSLAKSAACSLVGYDAAAWGAPEQRARSTAGQQRRLF